MKRAVRSVLRLLAAGILVIGGMVVGLEFMRYRLADGRPRVAYTLLGLLAMGTGLVLFATSSRLAARYTDDLEE